MIKEKVEKDLQENNGGTLTYQQAVALKIDTFTAIYGNRSRFGIAVNDGSIYEVSDSRGIYIDDLIVADPAPFGDRSKAVLFTLAERPTAQIYGGLPEELRTITQKGDRIITVGLASFVYAPQIGKECADGGMFLYCEKMTSQPAKEESTQA